VIAVGDFFFSQFPIARHKSMPDVDRVSRVGLAACTTYSLL
jgi:hypothetical protein